MSEKNIPDTLLSNSLGAVASQSYRDSMRYFAGSVHIVTTNGQAGLRGLTISACCSLSDDPPTVLACLMRHKKSNHAFIVNQSFCINTLAGQHASLANIFAGKGRLMQEERFQQADWSTLQTGAPILDSALVALDCELTRYYEHETHYVLIGKVVGIKTNNHSHEHKTALAYLNRKYHELKID